MNITNCLCKCSEHSITDRYQSVQCRSCLTYVHLLCYDIPPYDDRSKRFECILCRVQNCDPFNELLQVLVKPFVLPSNHQKVELIEHFQLTKEQCQDLRDEKINLMIICTRVKITNEEDFPYEWPSPEGISLVFNGRTLPQYHIFYPLMVPNSSEDNVFHAGTNSVLIRLPKENKETLYPKSAFGACLMKKKDIKEVAKDLARKNPLTIEEARNKFESMKQKDLEILASFPIRDPITIQLLFVPSRGLRCKHLSCFDLMNFLKFNAYNQTPLRWKCPICRKQVLRNELVIDLYLHKILKDIKKELIEKNYTEEDINKISYICFDEKGNWKPKQDFSEEWEKQNRKNDKPRLKLPKPKSSNPSELSNKDMLNQADCPNQEASDSDAKDDVIMVAENLVPEERKEKDLNANNNRLYAEEITVEHCVMIHKDLVKAVAKAEMTTSEITDKITSKLKEFNVFKNFSDRKFYEFLLQAEINLYITSFFEEGQNLLEARDFDEFCEEASKSASAEIAKYILAWAITKENVVSIVYLISTRDERQGLDIKFALELVILTSYLIFKRKYGMNINRKHLMVCFGDLLSCFAVKLGFKQIHYQKIMTLFSVVLPDLNFPFFVHKSHCYEFYDQLSDFLVAFLSPLGFDEFKRILIDSHLPPYNPLEELEDRRLARHFLYFFVLVLRKKEPGLTLDRMYDVLLEWDVNNNMRAFMNKEHMNLFSISLEENEIKNIFPY